MAGLATRPTISSTVTRRPATAVDAISAAGRKLLAGVAAGAGSRVDGHGAAGDVDQLRLRYAGSHRR